MHRYPHRLVAILKWQGILTTTEAESVLKYGTRAGLCRLGLERKLRPTEYTCEAVGSYGGASKLLVDAWRNRAAIRQALA
jgi:hypothetical protein